MTVQESTDYDKLKQKVLKTYELVPEAYRQKFRSSSKSTDVTHVEFAHEKEQLFDKWVADRRWLWQIAPAIIEEFKRHIHNDIKTRMRQKLKL